MKISFLILFLLIQLFGFSQTNLDSIDEETQEDSVSFLTILNLENASKDGFYTNGYVVNIDYQEAKKLDGKKIRISGFVTIVNGLDYTLLKKGEFGIEIARQGRSGDTKHIENPIIEIFQEYTKIPKPKYVVCQYDSVMLLNIMTYQYSDMWDIDSDGIKDSIQFIGNGGAHVYFFLKIRLSSKNAWQEFKQFEIDIPYFSEIESMDEIGEYFPQFAVYDFDNDGIDEIYLNFPKPSEERSTELLDYGINSNQVLIDYDNGKLNVKDH